jgi:hypothetical protein
VLTPAIRSEIIRWTQVLKSAVVCNERREKLTITGRERSIGKVGVEERVDAHCESIDSLCYKKAY